MIGSCEIKLGNSLDVLAELENNSIQSCITSPPYWGLRDYNVSGQIGLEDTPEDYIRNLVNVFHEVKRVMKPTGTLWLNIGDSYYNYRPGKGQSLVKQSLSNSTQDLPKVCPRRANKLEGLKEKDLIGIPWMLAFALRKDGWYLRQDIIWHKPNPMPESVMDRCTKSHEYIFLMTKSEKYYFNSDAIKEPVTDVNKRNLTRNKRSVWTVPTSKFKGTHFATFPQKLIEPCILSGTQEYDLILDPFSGAGTVGVVALKNNRKFLGIELNPDYVKLANERISLESKSNV